MFTLVTGVPGTGKTLWTLTELSKIKDRPIYYSGIPDLSGDLGWIELDNPLRFHEELPDGSIVVIDEVQQYFRTRAPKTPVPDALQFIETHRHKGIDIYFITQKPKFLDHHARGLAGRHVNFNRNFGLQQSVMYDFNRYTDIDDKWALKDAVKTTFKFPKSSYGLYKSAEVHTHKRRLPKKLLIIPLLFIVIASFIYLGYSTLFADSTTPTVISSVTGLPQAGTTLISNNWENAFIPAVAGLPFTAPIYKDLAVPKSIPMITGCVKSELTEKCNCYTQQGTKISMSLAQCNHFVKNPIFDFTKKPPSDKPELNKEYNQREREPQQGASRVALSDTSYKNSLSNIPYY